MKNKEQNPTISIDTLYSEACTTLRHYSRASMTIRVLSFAQAMIIVSGIGLLVQGNYYLKASFASIFGLFFTFTLFSLQSAYFKNAKTLMNHISKMEEKYDGDNMGSIRPLKMQRNERIDSIWKESIIIHGPYFLFGLMFVFLAIYNVFQVNIT